jgi:cytochrome c-type biogenesis protein CcmH/NrfG
LLAADRASEAEMVYREDLRRNPNNGWSLYGLKESLKAQRNAKQAASTDKLFKKAWKRADIVLTASRF